MPRLGRSLGEGNGYLKALQCALALEIRSVSTGRGPIAAARVS